METDADFLMTSEILFQNLAPAYLTDLKRYYNIFLRDINISALEAYLVSYWWATVKMLQKLWKNKWEFLLTDSCTKVWSFKSNKSYNLRIFKSEKILLDGNVQLLKAIALTTFFWRRYIGL